MQLKELAKLHQRKYREQYQKFLLEGEHLALELERAMAVRPALSESVLYVTEGYRDWPTALEKVLLSDGQMAKLAETKSPQGIIACVPFFALDSAFAGCGAEEKAIYLHEVQDPGNLGSVLRSLAWFGGFRCLLSPNSVDPYHAKSLRAGMGAVFHVPLELEVKLESLASRFPSIAYLDVAGRSIAERGFGAYPCYLFGNEARGLPESVTIPARDRFTIPGCGAIDSLNLAASVNIGLYAIQQAI